MRAGGVAPRGDPLLQRASVEPLSSDGTKEIRFVREWVKRAPKAWLEEGAWVLIGWCSEEGDESERAILWSRPGIPNDRIVDSK